jgi:hypothetical protein
MSQASTRARGKLVRQQDRQASGARADVDDMADVLPALRRGSNRSSCPE